jgi:hypothetical protein
VVGPHVAEVAPTVTWGVFLPGWADSPSFSTGPLLLVATKDSAARPLVYSRLLIHPAYSRQQVQVRPTALRPIRRQRMVRASLTDDGWTIWRSSRNTTVWSGAPRFSRVPARCPLRLAGWCDVRRTPRYDERPARVRGRPGARCSLATKECSAAARAHVPGCRDLPSGAAARAPSRSGS